MLVLPAAGQATITVDTAGDNATGGDGRCTLREAITNANANSDTTSGDCTAGVGATDAIQFNISGGSPATIQPLSALPTITEGVTIDGTTQGCSGGVPCIELDGTSAGANGLFITGSNSTIRGLVINRFVAGVGVSGAGATGNTISGNYIGTDVTGAADLGNSQYGVNIISGATSNTIGGTVSGARNVISGNDLYGVRISGSGTTGNQVQGNYIGTNAAGTADLGNSSNGVFIATGAASNTIGGTVAGARNVISGNNTLNNTNGVRISGSGTMGNQVQGNYIGTNAAGTADLGNSQGVLIFDGASNNTIGGTVAGARNVISGNDSRGVLISGVGTTGNQVQGNYIGTDVTGTADLGNSQYGVLISSSAANNTIGGTDPGAANTVAFNDQGGVAFSPDAGTGNAVQRNRLFENTQLGIDLGTDGVTANDAGDSDTGPNKLQNFPTLTAAVISGGILLVTYAVDTNPANATYALTVEFFEADTDDEEGETFLGSNTYTTTNYSGCGAAPCAKTVNLGGAAALGVSLGDKLVATATDNAGNTSEFSPSTAVVSVVPVTRYVAPTGSDTGNDCTDALTPCATIGHAVSQANVGDTIEMAAGTYAEPGLVIDKAVHVQGQGVIVQ